MWGPHGHVASPNWMEIQSRWIKEDNEILSTNCRLTCGKRSTLPLDQFSQSDLEKEKEREKEKKNTDFRERVSNFFLDFPAIGPLVSSEARRKVAPHGKGYGWASVLGDFRQTPKGRSFLLLDLIFV